jgi:hypothetical protein
MSRNNDVFGRGVCILGTAFAILLPQTGQSANKQQTDRGVAAARLTDDAGNTYGITAIEGPDSLPGDELAPLGSIVRFADAIASPASQGLAGARGKTVRLKPSLAHPCSQTLRGSDQNNLLDGSMSACNEGMFGYGGDDILIGGSGKNRLQGGKGADLNTGGAGGANTFAYTRAADSQVDTADIITDFKRTDVLDFSKLARTAGVRLSYIGWNEFTGVPGQVNYNITEYWKCDPDQNCYDQYITVVGVDLTGSGTADFCIDLVGRHHPKSRNFVLKIE